jgi:hypothetical protein
MFFCVRDRSENPFLPIFFWQKRLKRIARPVVYEGTRPNITFAVYNRILPKKQTSKILKTFEV